MALAVAGESTASKRTGFAEWFDQYGVRGTLMLCDATLTACDVHNPQRARERHSPASTFKIVNALIAGPGGAAEPAVPEGTSLRQLYVDRYGTAWVDFSAELKANLPGGSASETLTVYAIVNSIGLNVPEIRSVGILVGGNPVETLNGHLDLRRPLPPRRDWLAKE